MLLKSYHDVELEARKKGGGKIAVAGAEGKAVLEAVRIARDDGIMQPILVGHKEKIRSLADEIGLDLTGIAIHHETNESESAEVAVKLVDAGDADGLMKGKVSTPVLLKAVLNKKYNLRTDRLLSHVAILEIPSYHKLLMVTDGGMVIQPTLEQKIGIVKNGLDVIRKLGVEKPKVAVLAAIETVNPDMPETVDADKLVTLATTGEFGDAIIEGPVAMDVALSREAAQTKGVSSRISGDPDIMLVPNVACGNIFAKGLWHLAGAKIAGLIAGARKPIILLSRSDNAVTKLNSIALAVLSS